MKKGCGKIKKLISVILALCVLCAGAALASDAGERERLAKEYIPEEVSFESEEFEDGYIELDYVSADGKREYSLVLNEADVAISLSFEDKSVIEHAGAALDEAGILSAFLLAFPEAEHMSISLNKDDGCYEYAIAFKNAAGVFGTCEFCAADGALEGYKLYYTFAPEIIYEALAVIQAAHPGAKLAEFEIDSNDGATAYEGKASFEGRLYEFKIDAKSMKLREWEIDD